MGRKQKDKTTKAAAVVGTKTGSAGKPVLPAGTWLETKFGRVGFGKNVVGVPVSIEDGLTLTQAHKLFCGMQLQIEARYDPNARGDDAGQQVLGQREDHETAVNIIADCHSFHVYADRISVALKINRTTVDPAEISGLANQHGRIMVAVMGKASADTKGEDGDEDSPPDEGDEHLEGLL